MERKELIEVIKAIKPGLVKDGIVELADFISFNDNEIVSYNNEVSISYPYDTGIIGAVKGDELLRILQSMPDDISIEKIEDKLVITKKGKKNKIKAELNVMDIQLDTWPEIPEKFDPLPKNIIQGLKFCMFSTSSDLSTGAFSCILIKNARVVSCDNHRATDFILDSAIETELLIPLKLAKVLINYDIVNYAQNDSWLFFEDEFGIIICCKKVEYDYPIKNVSALFKYKGDLISVPDNFKSILDRSEIFSQVDIENQKIVTLELLKNKIIISSFSEVGNYSEEIELEYTGKELTILVNPVNMKQILEKCTELTLTEKNIRFDTKTFSHVIQLLSN